MLFLRKLWPFLGLFLQVPGGSPGLCGDGPLDCPYRMSAADAALINDQVHEFSDSDFPFGDDANDVDDNSEVVERNGESYATRAACNVPRNVEAASEVPGESRAGPRAYTQSRFLSSFEKEHFHPHNVTPERPCTAFFRVDSEETSKSLFDRFLSYDIPASAVRCLQRKPTGEVYVTFSTAGYCARFIERTTFSAGRYGNGDTREQTTLTYLTVYDAPYEMPDVAIEERLKRYCKVHYKRRGRLQGYRDVLNGLRHYRVELRSSVPCYMRFGKFQVRFYHDDQIKTCRRCGGTDHIAKDCVNSVCFNCDQIGHVAKHCPEDMKCCICKSPQHKAIDCPLSWYRRPATYRERTPVDSENAGSADAARPAAVPQRDPPLDDDPGSCESSQADVPDLTMEDTTTTGIGISEADPLAVAIPSKGPQALLDSQGFFVPPVQPSDLPERPETVLPSECAPTPDDDTVDESSDEVDIVAETDEEETKEGEGTPVLPMPSLVATAEEVSPAAKRLKMVRQRLGRRCPARPPPVSVPTRRSTAPTPLSLELKAPVSTDCTSKPTEPDAPT